jgi:hypothetical protein
MSNKVKLVYAGNTRPPPWFRSYIKLLVLWHDIIIFTRNYHPIAGDKTEIQPTGYFHLNYGFLPSTHPSRKGTREIKGHI